MKRIYIPLFVFILVISGFSEKRVRDYGIKIGILKTGKYNSITDVKGVLVGHKTIVRGKDIRTGITAVLPHPGNIFKEKVPAAIYVGNGYGKLTGYTQVRELGNIETPIILTNTMSVPTAADALQDYILSFPENRNVRSINPIVGETNDGWLNNIRKRIIKKSDVIEAIKSGKTGFTEEGDVGAGTGTICFGFKGGIGTSSRKLPENLGGYTVGVLVQTNFGGILRIRGVPVGIMLNKYYLNKKLKYNPDGSCMIVVATDAPLSSRNLFRLAKRAMLGLANTGGISSNGSGDYIIAFSTAKELRISTNDKSPFRKIKVLKNDKMSPLFEAVIEATEEAILNSLFKAKTMEGRDKHLIKSLPIKRVVKMILGK
jgi:D-aminopeptidase